MDTISRRFNPVTKSVTSFERCISLESLQQCCRKQIIQTLSLKHLDKASNLPLPPKLQRLVGTIKLVDFKVDAELLAPENHINESYPATCSFTGNQVIIKILHEGQETPTDQHGYITSFEENNSICVILEHSQTLKDLIDMYKSAGRYFPESVIKETIASLVEYLLDNNISPQAKISSRSIHYTPKGGKIFIDLTEEQTEQDLAIVQFDSNSSAVYEAPEVIERKNPDHRAFVWTIGCLIYEMLALEAAYYDRSEGNPFAVYMDITQGVLPPEPHRGSQDLKSLLWDCLKLDPSERASFSQINPKLKNFC